MIENKPATGRLKEVAIVFLKLGIFGFGGPAAHTAMMEDEVVRRRKWISHERFLDLLGASNLIPGPNSTELAIHLGHARAGWLGLLVAGVSFILPATAIVLAAAWAYTRYGDLPEVGGLLLGVKPVIIAIIAQALYRLGRTALKSRFLGAFALLLTALSLWGLNQILLLFGAGLLLVVVRRLNFVRKHPAGWISGGLAIPVASGSAAALATSAAGPIVVASQVPFALWPLFLFFLKVGSVLFGSGYVLLAFLRTDLVMRFQWLTESQLLDAVAVGQMTPGPLFTTATFIGYLLGGTPAALVATAGIFVPAFFFVALSSPFVPRLRQSPTMSAFLDGVIVASLALMALVSVQLGIAVLVNPASVTIAAVSALLLFRLRFNSAWLVLGGGIVGLCLRWLGLG